MADANRPAAPDDPAQVVDIQFTDRRHVYGPRLRAFLDPGVVVVILFYMFLPRWNFFVGLALVMTAASVLNIYARRRRADQLRIVISDAAFRSGGHDAEALIRLVAADRRSKGLMHDVLLELSSQLVREGSQGRVFRLHPSGVPAVPRPLEVPFEPRPLNEEIRTTEELLHVDGTNDSVGDRRIDEPVWELVRRWLAQLDRRLRNNAPRWALGLFAFMALLSVFAAWNSRDPIMWVGAAFFGGGFVLILSTPARHRGGQKEWYIVPGGIAVRAKAGKEVPVQVFDRRESVMCLAPWHFGTRCWSVAVADAKSSNHAILSPDEVTLLLRAWLSPLRPPESERISDLM